MRRFLLMVMVIIFGIAALSSLTVPASAQSIATYSLQDLMETLQISPGTLTAMSHIFDDLIATPTRSRATVIPTRTFVATQRPATTRAASTPAPPPRATSVPNAVPDNSAGNKQQYVVLQLDDYINVDAVVAFMVLVTVIWLVILGILSLIGTILSRLMTRAIAQSINSGILKLNSFERIINSLYGFVTFLLAVYFLLSIVILTAVVITLIMVANRVVSLTVPSFIILGISVYGGYYLFGALVLGVRSLFIPNTTPGTYLILGNEAPMLWSMVQEVATHLQTHVVDKIYLIPGTSLGVYERGALMQKLMNKGERVMLLGLGLMDGLTQTQLKAILAHEYAHYLNRDTGFAGDVAMRINMMIAAMHTALKRKNYNHWFNPIWAFLMLFGYVFTKITFAAIQYRELFADRIAAALYGSTAYITALLRTTYNDVAWDTRMRREVNAAAEEKRTLHNLYQLPPFSEAEQSQINDVVNLKLNQQLAFPKTHPPTNVRIALVAKLAQPGEVVELLDQPAWDLFPQPERFQEAMTALVQRNLNLFQFFAQYVASNKQKKA